MQSKLGSLLESFANILVGYGISTVAQKYVFAMVGIEVSWHTTAIIGFWMTLISIVRSYTLRRLFNRYTVWKNNANCTQNARSH